MLPPLQHGRDDAAPRREIAVTPGAHAVLLLDQAGWHLSADLVVLADITLLPPAAKCPELNLPQVL